MKVYAHTYSSGDYVAFLELIFLMRIMSLLYRIMVFRILTSDYKYSTWYVTVLEGYVELNKRLYVFNVVCDSFRRYTWN